MNYSKKLLQSEIDTLRGKYIKNIFYYTDYEGYSTFKQLSNEIVEIPLLGILLETLSGDFLNIISFDYAPYYDLGGIRVFQDDSLVKAQGRPNQITKSIWSGYSKKKIVKGEIIESSYKTSNELLIIPFGIKLFFEGGEIIYIMNLSVEGFIEEDKIYDLCRGGEELLLFLNNDIFQRHKTLKDNFFVI